MREFAVRLSTLAMFSMALIAMPLLTPAQEAAGQRCCLLIQAKAGF